MNKKALVMGHFSTVGDIECLQIVSRWLDQLGIPYDVAPYLETIRMAISGACDPRRVDPLTYSHLLVVCGPCWKDLFYRRQEIDLAWFNHCIRIGINLTMIDPLEDWNPFDFLIERDSDRTSRPDLTFLETTPEVPVVGRCLIHKQKEFGERQRIKSAIQRINDLIDRRGLAVIDIDTRWPPNLNTAGHKNPAQIAAIMKRIDVLLTNRLHGLVFAVKSGVPAIAVDSIAGGGKVTAQARAIGWPMVVEAEKATPEWMECALDWCLTIEAKEMVKACRENILEPLRAIEEDFFAAMTSNISPTPLTDHEQNDSTGGWFTRWFRSRS